MHKACSAVRRTGQEWPLTASEAKILFGQAPHTVGNQKGKRDLALASLGFPIARADHQSPVSPLAMFPTWLFDKFYRASNHGLH